VEEHNLLLVAVSLGCGSCRLFFGEVLGKSIILFVVDPSLKRIVGIISEKYQEDCDS